MESYNMGLITNNERYNQIIDIWTNINMKLTKTVLDHLTNDQQGFNPVYMMLDSGARGSKEQIRQLSGMRGLMAKPPEVGSRGRSGHREPDSVWTSRRDCLVHEVLHFDARRP